MQHETEGAKHNICRQHRGLVPGCGHGIIVRLLAEAVESLGIEERLVLVVDVACGSLARQPA